MLLEHACQQRLVVECRNRNNGMDPLIGTIVVASAREVDDGMSTGMSTRCARRQRCFEQEDDNQSNITFEGMDDIDDFGPMIPSPSGEVDAMEADFHSRGSISAVHELVEVAAYGSYGWPPPLAERPSLPNSFTQASNMTVQLGTAISLPVDDVLVKCYQTHLLRMRCLTFTSCSQKQDHRHTSLMTLLASWKSMPDTHSIRVKLIEKL
jgi:hypothetical protein